jgi:predicted DNA-binding transcriptional regulator AlpA
VQRLLNFDDLVAAGYVANRVTLSRRIRRGEFPAPINVGSRNVAWLKEEIDAWEVARIAHRDNHTRRVSGDNVSRGQSR